MTIKFSYSYINCSKKSPLCIPLYNHDLVKGKQLLSLFTLNPSSKVGVGEDNVWCHILLRGCKMSPSLLLIAKRGREGCEERIWNTFRGCWQGLQQRKRLILLDITVKNDVLECLKHETWIQFKRSFHVLSAKHPPAPQPAYPSIYSVSVFVATPINLIENTSTFSSTKFLTWV